MKMRMVFGAVGALTLAFAGPAGTQAGEITPICDIQGAGANSPLADQTVTTEGVVTADLIETTLNGFFMQQPACDKDPATSNGLFVYDGNRDVQVEEGQRVRATGQVKDRYGLTEIVLDTLEVVGPADLPDPNEFILDIPRDPLEASAYLEAHEGMWVATLPLRVVGATNSFGEAYVVPWQSGVTRLFRHDNDGRKLGLVFPDFWYALWHGDGLGGVQGPLTYSFEQFKVVAWPPGDPERYRDDFPHPYWEPPRAEPSGIDELTIATFNLENLFDPVDDPGKNDANWTPTPAEYTEMIARRAHSIGMLLGAPDVVALQEVEKLDVLEDLAQHRTLADAHYGAELIEGPDLRGIDVGLLYNRERLRVLSREQRQACTSLAVEEPGLPCQLPDGGIGSALFSRPPLVVRLEVVETGERLALIVNHFKSKRGGNEATQPIRLAMAEHNLALLSELKTAEPETPVIVLGDLNDFEDTPPITRLTEGDLLRDLHALVPTAEDYTFIFNGVSQNLDYILVEPGLPVEDFGPVHINVDFPVPPPGDDDPNGTLSPRSSDHDPLLLRIPLPGERRWRVYMPLTINGAPPETGRGSPPPTTDLPPTATPTMAPSPTSRPVETVTATPPTTPGGPPRSPLRIETVFYDGEEKQFEGDEYVEITNIATDEVALTGWQLISVKGDQRFPFPAGFTMSHGQSCRVYTDEDHPEHCGLNWGSSDQAIWRNSGDKAELRDAAGTLIDWYCYGDHEDQCR